MGANALCWENERGFMLVAPKLELPNTEEGGAPAGVKDAAEEGGGPAGVVEGLFEAPNENALFDFLSGVDGAGLDE